MYLVQLLLPLYDGSQQPFPRREFERVAAELTERFGGMTAYAQAPAHGIWEGGGGRKEHDDIIVHEVMTESLDRPWWAQYRGALEQRFAQDEVVIRALSMERL